MILAPHFRKHWPEAPADFFAVEAAGLRWLAAAAAAPVVEVLEADRASITVARLLPVPPTSAAAADFGTALARTHAAGAAAFGEPPSGWDGDGYIGRQRLTLRPEARWGRFYAEQRMLPYARAARDLGHLTRQQLVPIERVAERIAAGDFDDDRPPARIHGDLWSGNLIGTARGLVLIDPAAHGGHGLTDLAMLSLFGAPHLETILAAYAEAAALPSGWRALIGLHQLHPLLVHAVSHGPSYGSEAAALALRYL
ncbi:fructosamine kinase family protein [Microlunatus speluncae]|uniref:fructosamine kinase family protein n=1 Tax=Microlunatus speluncae TaxID=2594267 RepID=UPI0012667D67|nr:fructosamine kinase family protein [Microlunatus speluncae]